MKLNIKEKESNNREVNIANLNKILRKFSENLLIPMIQILSITQTWSTILLSPTNFHTELNILKILKSVDYNL